MTAKPGVLLDVDGTLVDTTYLHTVAWWEALRRFDHVVPMAEIHRGIGMGSDKLVDHLLGNDRDKAADDAMNTAHDVLYGAWRERLRPLPGAADLLRACADRLVLLPFVRHSARVRPVRHVVWATVAFLVVVSMVSHAVAVMPVMRLLDRYSDRIRTPRINTLRSHFNAE